MNHIPEDYFPPDYRQGRAAFIAAAEAAGLGVTTRMHPDVKGQDGLPLFIDTTTIGPRDAKRTLLLISGTHGVEGYFGSGVETGLLREDIAAKVPEGAKLVMLHALNPYGFSWNRRVNEDNVDVNRNFADFASPPSDHGYGELADAIAPKDISAEAMQAANAKLRAYSERHGPFALQSALSSGQYRFADGIYYGGAQLSWSSLMLKDVLREELAGVATLVVIDFHTGLGESGAAEIITEDAPGTPGFVRAKAIWGDSLASTEGGGSLSAPLTGTIDAAMAAWVQEMGAGKTALTFVALEVGTEPVPVVFEALRKDNWLHCHGGLGHPDADAIKQQIRAAFYPDTVEWKRAVWAHGQAAVDAALAAIA
jgi:hypothetical protein